MSCRWVFYPQIPQINADYGGMSCRWVFYPQIPQINADYGGMSCRCAAIHAAGVFIRRLRAMCFLSADSAD
jgi:hypothetical protein